MLFGYDEMISLKILNLNFLFHTLSIFFQFGGNENPSISFPSLSLLLIQTREEFPFPSSFPFNQAYSVFNLWMVKMSLSHFDHADFLHTK